MVKGNFQHRLEKAARLKAEKLANKELRAAGHAPDQIMSKILSLDPEAEVMLLARDQAQRPLCRAHFFDEACTNRRCKFSHALSIASFAGAAAVCDLCAEGDLAGGSLTQSPLERCRGPASMLCGSQWKPGFTFHVGRGQEKGKRHLRANQ